MKSYKATGMQKQFWILNQLAPHSSAYTIPLCFKLTGSPDVTMLEKSIAELFRRHDILRTMFFFTENELFFTVSEDVPNQIIDSVDLELDASSGDELPSELLAELRRPFNLKNEKPIRVKLFRIRCNLFYFMITMHHIITDLRTKDILTEELGILYNSFLQNKPAAISAVCAYSAFCEQMDTKLQTERSRMSRYWQTEVTKTEPLNFPLDKTRPSFPQHAGNALSVTFTIEETAVIDRFAQEMNLTSFIVLLASYAILLHKYSASERICIGVPLTNRRMEEFSNTAGCFVNIVPIVVEFTGGTTVRDIIHSIRKKMLFAHRNQELPFVEIAQLYTGNKETSINPVFQAGFTFEHSQLLQLQNIATEQLLIPGDGAQLDIFATFWYEHDSIGGWIEYDTDLFEKETVVRFIANYKHMTLSMTTRGDDPVASSVPVDSAQLFEITEKWNETSCEFPPFTNTQQLIAAAALSNKDRIAIRFGEIAICYQELMEWSQSICDRLQKVGLTEGEPVGIYLNRSHWVPVSILGIWCAGCCFVPLDPNFPENRIEYAVHDSGIRYIVLESALIDRFADKPYGIVCVDNLKKDRPTPVSYNGTIPQSTAYIMYTSGSTGKPKGVVIPHGALINFLQSMAVTPGIAAHDILVAVTTVSFDISMLELFLPLTGGAQVVIAAAETVGDGQGLSDLMHTVEATMLQATPATWKLLIAAGWKPQGRLKALCGGEAMPFSLMQELLARCDELWNMYGPTETTVWSACHQCTADEKTVIIGKPVANTEMYILDSQYSVLPVGVWGELFIGGAGVASGYLNRAELTSERFIENPFKPGEGQYLYRTGDVCRFRNDGSIEYGWRTDNQVKIRGHRIELGEIETVLRTHAAISDVAVVIKGKENRARLVAYLVVHASVEPTPEALRSFMRSTIPDYMCPAQFITVGSIPLTPNGKVDKKSLPDPDTHRPKLASTFVAASTAYEQILTEIWKEVLHLDEIGIRDNFFDIGGNSMSIFTINLMISERLKRTIPLTRLFQYPTIESLARFLNPEKEDSLDEGEMGVSQRTNLKKQALSRKRQASMQRNRNG